MCEDREGFLYPNINLSLCINCDLCERVCPVINQTDPTQPLTAQVAFHIVPSIRHRSSSGGVFTALAEKVIRSGGVVFGARFDKQWNVVHDWTDTLDGLEAFRKAKYVQSNIGNSFIQVKAFLKAKRIVLFSGTPCQTAALRLFLRKPYDNLLVIDVVCHGVPSPEVWRNYLAEILQKHTGTTEIEKIHDICFRDKTYSWEHYNVTFTIATDKQEEKTITSNYRNNPYMHGFLDNLYLRPSCHACPSKPFKSGSDLTIGDYWGVQFIHPNLNDDKGMCLVITQTEKGAEWLNRTTDELTLVKSDLEQAATFNSSLLHSARRSIKRRIFFALSSLSVTRRVKLLCMFNVRPKTKGLFLRLCSKMKQRFFPIQKSQKK